MWMSGQLPVWICCKASCSSGGDLLLFKLLCCNSGLFSNFYRTAAANNCIWWHAIFVKTCPTVACNVFFLNTFQDTAACMNIRWKEGGNSSMHDTTQEHTPDSPHQAHPGAVECTQHSMRQLVAAQKALRQLPWLHSAAIMQPCVLSSAFSAALLKPSTSTKYNKEELTGKESPLLHGCRRHSWRGCLIKTASYSCPTPPHPSVNITPARTCGGEHMGHTLAFMIQHEVTCECPIPGRPGEPAFASPCVAFSMCEMRQW